MHAIRPTRLLVALAAAGLFTAGLAACGDDDDAGSPTTTAATDPEPGTDDGEGEAVVEVELVDYDFVGLPDTVSAGTTLTVTNTSETELHEIVALRLPDEEDRSVAELVQLPPDEAEAALAGGPPAMVLLAAPGGDQITAVGDGTLGEPGRYALVCMIPTGADPDEYLTAAAESEGGPPQGVAGGPPHVVHGMWAELTVE